MAYQFLDGEYVWISSKNLSGWCKGQGLGLVQPPNSTSKSLYTTRVAPALGEGQDPRKRQQHHGQDVGTQNSLGQLQVIFPRKDKEGTNVTQQKREKLGFRSERLITDLYIFITNRESYSAFVGKQSRRVPISKGLSLSWLNFTMRCSGQQSVEILLWNFIFYRLVRMLGNAVNLSSHSVSWHRNGERNCTPFPVVVLGCLGGQIYYICFPLMMGSLGYNPIINHMEFETNLGSMKPYLKKKRKRNLVHAGKTDLINRNKPFQNFCFEMTIASSPSSSLLVWSK